MSRKKRKNTGNPARNPGPREVTLKSRLGELKGLADDASQVEELRFLLVRSARELGATWSEIGDALGVSRQAAAQMAERREGALKGVSMGRTGLRVTPSGKVVSA